MFNIGDFIIYGNNGVCKITNVGPMKMPGVPKDRLYYTMVPCYIRDSEIFTPIDNERVVMRKVMSKDEAEDFIQSISEIKELEIIEEKKRELERIVANYERLQFQEKADTAFDINNLKQYKFKIGNLKIGEKDSLNLKKLTSTYNREMKKNIDDIADGLEKNHIPAFAQWKNRLLQLLEDNIVEINPDLRELNAEVNAQKKEIEDLKDKGLRLREYKNQIESLMKWR